MFSAERMFLSLGMNDTLKHFIMTHGNKNSEGAHCHTSKYSKNTYICTLFAAQRNKIIGGYKNAMMKRPLIEFKVAQTHGSH